MTIVTRFAPSPTGYLHIGGARTALFNYLYSKAKGGKFLLRIEDTDLERSTQEAVDAIINGLSWLGLQHDDTIVFQMKNQARHIQVAQELLKNKHAYKCYCTKEMLDERRANAEKEHKVYLYDGRCSQITKDRDEPYAVRLKINKEGSTIINDSIMGKIEVKNSQLDDFIILRSDSVPTYMFAVVVDDHDMHINHIIRGDDHLTNAFRQYQIYKALNWNIPEFAHLPLIHSQDGAKLSKRHGAISVESYRDMGFLPEAIRNYLLKLGWSHGNDEIISDKQAIEWFDIKDVNKSPAKFDMVKLTNINHHYIKLTDNNILTNLMEPFIKISENERNPKYKSLLLALLDSIKNRSKTIIELVDNANFIIKKNITIDDTAKPIIDSNQSILKDICTLLENAPQWEKDTLHDIIKAYAVSKELKLGQVAEILRICLCGKTVCAASNFDIMVVLGKEESMQKIKVLVQ